MLLFLVLLVGFFCQTMNGFDTMLFGGLLANKEYFLAHFHGENKGIWAGLITSMYQIGGVCALPFVGPAIDSFGRRVGMVIGSVAIVIGTVIQGTTASNASEGQMMGGRFLLGFGVSIAAAAGPIWIVETAHPRYRGVVTGLCNTTWLVGAILASGTVRGGLDIKSNNSWLIPIWLQMVFPGLIIVFAFFVPESPRWQVLIPKLGSSVLTASRLYTRGKTQKAIDTLTYWHGNDNRESVWVRLQLSEYETHLEMDGSVSPDTSKHCADLTYEQDKRWWDYRPIFNKRANFYRTMTACWFSAFSQWCGNSVLSYFMAAVLDTAGVNTSIGKANVNLGYSCFQFFWAVVGAHFVEKIGRRKMMLCGFFGTAVVWVCMTAAAGTLSSSLVSGSAKDGDAVYSNDNAGNAVLAFIFIFGAVYSFNITPLQSLYPVECFSFEIRAKGMALQSFAVNAAGLMNQFAWPIALKEIAWKTYIIFIIWCALQGVIAYFVFPETRKRTVCTFIDRFLAQKLMFDSSRNSTRSSRRRIPSNSPLPATSLPSLKITLLLLSMMM